MIPFFEWTDSALILFFRMTANPYLGFFLGTVCISIFCVVIGRLTLLLGSRINAASLQVDHGDMVHMHNLSMYALVHKNKAAYQSCNKQANEAFGKVFFANIALGSSAFWPVPFALAWMQYRFGGVAFPLPRLFSAIGDHVGFMFIFFPILVVTFIVVGRAFGYMSKTFHGKGGAKAVISPSTPTEKLVSLKELTQRMGNHP